MVMISGDSAGHSDSQSQTDDDNNHLTCSYSTLANKLKVT